MSLVIPTWNGLGLLQRFLPSVVEEAARFQARSQSRVEVVISDDGSTDGTVEWLRQKYASPMNGDGPGFVVARSDVNQGFAPAANQGVEAAQNETVVLLNNDLEMLPGALDFVPRWFNEPKCFGVAMRGLDLDRNDESQPPSFSTGGKIGRAHKGFWEVWRNYDAEPDASPRSPAPAWRSFFLPGGFCAFRRSVFFQLGGFDVGFAPYYWEDVDLSYRARKRGWWLGYEPAANVRHALSASVSKHRSVFRREVVIHRNKLRFHWKNLDGSSLRRQAVWSVLLLVQRPLRGDFAYPLGFARALGQIPGILAERRRERPFWVVRDRDLELTQKPT